VVAASCAPCEHLASSSSPIPSPIQDGASSPSTSSPLHLPAPVEVPTAWDDIDASSIARDTEEPPKGRSSSIDASSEQEKAASDHSATESTQASTAREMEDMHREDLLATDSNDVSEVDLPGKCEDMQPAYPTTHKCTETPVAGDDSQDAMSDLMLSIRALFELKVQDAADEPEFLLPDAEEEQQGSDSSKAADETPVAVPEAATDKQEDIEFLKVLHPFTAANGTQLSLQVGDTVEIIEKLSSGWTYGGMLSEGQAVENSLAEGWFPNWAVCV